MHTRYFALFLLMGCLGEAAEEEIVSETESEIVGGVVTTARPEIGRFVSAAGSCTATLIGPSLVITAAHCLLPEYTGTVPQNASFRFTDFSGVARTYAVDRLHSFATRRFERPFVGSPFTTDVAIAHLMTPVPATQAIPTTIAMQEPAIGETSTTFGFGCTSREPETGAGTKRMFTFAYGTQTRALCWGDSGGPTVFGTGGPVWGINSDFDWTFPNWLVNSWLDMFANAVIYKKQIEDIGRAWDNGLEPGMDRFGFDYAVDLAATAAACKTICERDGNCRAFTWRASDQHCWRKSAASEPSPGAGLVSGLPSRIEPGVDRWGGDYAAFNHAHPEACAAQCGRDSNCQSWTHLGNMCWLKGTIAAAVVGSCPGCTSGVVRRGQEANVDRPGFTFQTHSASTASQCAQLCAGNPRCEAYSHQGFTCALKNAVPNAVATSPGAFVTSGVRRGVETSSDRPGFTYHTFTTTELTPNLCQATCANDAACQAWSFTPPTATLVDATCRLKNGVSLRQTAFGMVSGIKGHEMLP